MPAILPVDDTHAMRPGVQGMASAAWRASRLAVATGPWLVIGQVVAALLAGVLPVATAWLMKVAIDIIVATTAGQETGGVGALTGAVLGVGLTGLATGVLPHARRYLTSELGRRVALMAQGELYAAVNRLHGLPRYESPAYQDRLRLAQQGGGRAPGQTVASGLGVAQATLTVVGFLASLAVLSVPMTMVVIVASVPALVAQLRLSRARARMHTRITPMERRQFFFATLLTLVHAVTEAKLFGTGNWLRGRMLAELRSSDHEQRRMDRREVHVQGALAALAALVAAGGLGWAFASAYAGTVTVGDVTIFVAAVAGVQGGLAQIIDELTGAHQALLLFGHHLAVVDDPGDLPVPAVPTQPPALVVGVEFDNVWFRYADELPWTLRGVSITIPAGTACALVGINGTGKSTMVKLLCRLYDPQYGAIRWDGIDLRAMDPTQLRQRLGVLFQDYMQYDLTARENIGLGDLAIADDHGRLEEAARRAGVHDTLITLPHGYETNLSRIFATRSDKDDPATGVVLSGGQWQRLALARTLLRTGRDLLVLDEPSAGLDAAAEYEAHLRLRQLRAGRTSLLISHRLSTVRDADLIVVLDEGQVVEQGQHAELLASGGRYARLFRLQADGYHPDPDPVAQ